MTTRNPLTPGTWDGSRDESTMPAEEFQTGTQAIVDNIEQVIEGKTATVRLALAVLLAEGHLLIEDVPRVGSAAPRGGGRCPPSRSGSASR